MTTKYEFLEGDVYAVDKKTGELIWDEDIGRRMGALLMENIVGIEKHDHNPDDDVIVIDMPIISWMEALRCDADNDYTADGFFEFLSGLGTRVFEGTVYNGHNAFLRVRIFVQKPKERRREARKLQLEIVKN